MGAFTDASVFRAENSDYNERRENMKKAIEKMSDAQKVYTSGLIGGGILTVCFGLLISAIKHFGNLVKTVIDLFKKLGK